MIAAAAAKTMLKKLIGQRVTIWCANYIYIGKLMAVDTDECRLTEASVIYETGDLKAPTTGEAPYRRDIQALPGSEWFIRLAAIESFGVTGW